MATWGVISIGLACLILGYGVACWANGASISDLEQENRVLEIEAARHKREGH